VHRRQFLTTSFAAAAALPLRSLAQPNPQKAMPEDGKTIALLVYPGFTALDLIGPYQFLAALKDHKLILVSKAKGLLI
jgi:cyclohexyl-isocyanide hydratase